MVVILVHTLTTTAKTLIIRKMYEATMITGPWLLGVSLWNGALVVLISVLDMSMANTPAKSSARGDRFGDGNEETTSCKFKPHALPSPAS